MTKLCENCNEVEIDSSKSICLQCKETKIDKIQRKRKKEKLIGLISTTVLLLVGLLLFWGSTVYSEEKVESKFYQALEEKDKDFLKQMVFHSDYSEVEEFELDALLKLADKHGIEKIKTYYRLDTNSKVLGIFNKYDILMINQFLKTEKMDELVEYEINSQTVEGNMEPNGQIIYGPLLPGIYHLVGKMENSFGTFTKEAEISLISYDEKVQLTGLFFKTGYAQFIINDYYQHQIKDVSITMNGQSLIIEDGKTAVVGPIVIDDQLKYKVIVQTPWGVIESEEKLVKENANYVELQVVNDEVATEIMKVVERYGHQRAQSIASLSSEPLKIATNTHKNFISTMFNRIDGYKGQLIYAGIDRKAIYLKTLDDSTTQVTVLSLLKYEESYYILGHETELYQEAYPLNIRLVYNHNTKEWLVDQVMNLYNVAVDVTDTATVDPVLYEPNEDKIQQALNEEFTEIIEDLVLDGSYFAGLVLTNNDMYFLKRVLTTDGKINKQLNTIVDEAKNKKEQYYFEQAKVINYQLVDYDKWQLETEITYKKYVDDTEQIKTYKVKSYVVYKNNKFLFDEIISYKEQN